MTRTKRFAITAAIAAATTLASFSAEAFFGPFSWMRGGWGPGWGWGGPWYGYGYGYPYYGGWGYPYYGGWGGYPYHGGWGYPWGLSYPAVAAPVVTQPAVTADK